VSRNATIRKAKNTTVICLAILLRNNWIIGPAGTPELFRKGPGGGTKRHKPKRDNTKSEVAAAPRELTPAPRNAKVLTSPTTTYGPVAAAPPDHHTGIRMSSSEIAKLESRWRENPQGLTFAPLAEAYRKMREIPRALEILAEGLGRHPDYIPASIVLGRCQLDLGDDVQAESAFSHVLELDDDNVIALKALSEIAERQGRFDVAQARLMTLLSVDRSNDEARIQLARIEELRVAAEAAPDEAADMDLGGAEASDGAASLAGFDSDTAERPSPGISEVSGRVPAEEERFRTGNAADDAPTAPADAGLELEDNLQMDAEVEQLPD